MKSLLKVFGILIFVFLGTTSLASADTVDLAGQAWGADNSPFGGVGWINFNNTSTGTNTAVGSTEYKVLFDRTSWELTGYAWSERYGYIKFGGFADTEVPQSKTACQSNPNNQSQDGACNVHLVTDGAGYKLVGYARFCFVYQSGCSGNLRPATELGGYDGWIGFKTSGGSVTYSTGNREFQGYAWGGGSGSYSNGSYGEGSGWIKMNPTNGGVKCYKDGSIADCIDDDADKPIVTITATPNPTSSSSDVTLSWTVTNKANGCSADTSSSPVNSTWDAYTPTGTDIDAGTLNIGTISEPTTFTLSCTYSGKKGSADVLVNLDVATPQLTLSAPTTVVWGQSAQLSYTVTNIPFGCKANIYKNGTKITNTDIDITGDGTKTLVVSDTYTSTNVTATANWEIKCTDSTPPSPARTGSATARTTLDQTVPTVEFSVKDTGTNSTTTIPCSNTGVTIEYSTKDVIAGSCRAMIDGNTNNPDWGSSTTITENDHPTKHTKTTGAVTDTGSIIYQLQCRRLNGNLWTAGKVMNRSCTPGTLSVSTANMCVTPADNIDIAYSGSGLTSGTCERSWNNTKINTSTFNLHYITSASNLTVGQSYTFGISGCQDSSNPSGSTLAQSVSVDVQTTCGTNTGCVGSSNRCNPGKGPVFKEF